MRITHLFLLCTFFVLTACATLETKDFTDAEMLKDADETLAAIKGGQPAIKEPLTLYEAQARGLKYNLPLRVKLVEAAIMDHEMDISRIALLPEVTARGNSSLRSNQSGSRSESLSTGLESLEYSTSTDRDKHIAELTATWNMLDLGVGFVNAKQYSDRLKINREEKRVIVDGILRDVTNAYWRALIAQKHIGKINRLLEEIEHRLKKVKYAEKERLISRGESLQYQDALIDTANKLHVALKEFSRAKLDLASLLNLPTEKEFTLVSDFKGLYQLPRINVPINELERYALANRAEIKKEKFQYRIEKAEIAKVWMRMLPEINPMATIYHDNDSHIFFDSWQRIGVELVMNLFNPLIQGQNIKIAKQNMKLSEFRKQAMAIGILTQVNVAHKEYSLALDSIKSLRRHTQVKKSIYDDNQKQRKLGMLPPHGEAIDKAARLMADLNLKLNYADVHDSFGRMVASIGMDITPKTIESENVGSLAKILKERHARMMDINKETLVKQPEIALQ